MVRSPSMFCLSHPVKETVGQHARLVLVPQPPRARHRRRARPHTAAATTAAVSAASSPCREDARRFVVLPVLSGLLVHGGEGLIAAIGRTTRHFVARLGVKIECCLRCTGSALGQGGDGGGGGTDSHARCGCRYGTTSKVRPRSLRRHPRTYTNTPEVVMLSLVRRLRASRHKHRSRTGRWSHGYR